MKEELILRKYTRALFEVAEEQGLLEQVQKGMKRIQSNFEQLPELEEYFTNPQVEWKQKRELAQTLSKGLPKILVNFINLVMDKERQFILSKVAGEFQKLIDFKAKRKEAVVTTVIPLLEEEQILLKNKLKELYTEEFILSNEVDKTIMGGLVVKIGNTIIDGSVKRKLEELGRQLAKV